MKILLAPSETKRSGGILPFDLNTLLFDELLDPRMKLLHIYTNILQEGDMQVLSKMFGLKKESDILKYKRDILHEPAMKAIERYTGVAFDYLNYGELDNDAKNYIDENLLIFSNLFGVLSAKDLIPEYRLQQGKAIADIKPDQFYKPLLQPLLDRYLEGEDILDIRAGFYDKYYKPSLPHTTLKFIKEGKVVSHWAKAYRGIVLREIAKAGIKSIDEFIKLPIEGLSIHEIQTKKHKTEIIYTIENL
ncbi:MAG: hypothetical protein P794_02165 [Epsilonproteobacteria bacterium (ex Lamellibrachia satsuma)]|nr:MAG: hypothetical protein P794_02165 [Epsilonproteobacteria bacterium (ex Lamellibrachia satsuma)]